MSGVLMILYAIFWCYPAVGEISNKKDYNLTGDHNSTAISYSGLKRCQNAYRNLTAEKISRFVDASGIPGSGIYGGNTLWYGSYSECQKLSQSRYCWTMFPGNISLVKNSTKTYHIEWGVCMPNVCTKENLANDFEFFFKEISDIKDVTRNPSILRVECAEDPEYTSSVVITIVFCGVIIGTCLLATVMEILRDFDVPGTAKIIENGGNFAMGNDPNEKTSLLPEVKEKMANNEGMNREILHCFSILRNVKTVMNTSVGKSDLTYLHGIRVLSLFWIILLHVYREPLQFWPVDNVEDIVRRFRELPAMVPSVAYGVDTFLVLSGLLVMYTNMCKKVKNNGQTNWFKYYFHRFWRLTPTYAFCILLNAKLRPFFGVGPLWFMQADTTGCSEYWWTNLIYVNNFVHCDDGRSEMCLGQTWYLALDMQFFALSPIFLLIAYRFRIRPLLCVVGVFILASVIVTLSLIVADTDNLPLIVNFARKDTFFNQDQEEALRIPDANFFSRVYSKPYCRISPYLMGMVLGYVIYEHYSREFKLSWKIVVILWGLAIALALTDIYAPYSGIKEDPHIWTTAEKATFGAVKWPIWGLCIVWFIFACHYNYAGLIKDILAAKFWIPLSRINYAAFIIHYDVMLVMVYNIESPIHHTSFTTVTYFLSILVLTYAIAFVITVMVELPFANLEALAWKKWGKK